MPETPMTFEDVELLKDSGMTLRCRVQGKVVVVGRLQVLAGTTVSMESDRGRLVLPR
jgi:hypothetical protein